MMYALSEAEQNKLFSKNKKCGTRVHWTSYEVFLMNFREKKKFRQVHSYKSLFLFVLFLKEEVIKLELDMLLHTVYCTLTKINVSK